ncbi:MAG: hypothetical protein KF688_19635 [Pirellulales bacterium]|nr:hypothetical protein [Pirellulales bacterium]
MTQVLRLRPTPAWQALDTTEDPPAELVRRHLGVPSEAEWETRFDELLERTRRWYRANARPWAILRRRPVVRIDDPAIRLDAEHVLTSATLARSFSRGGVDEVVLFGATAGAEVDRRLADMWQAGRPDEAMFLNAWAIAVVEHQRAQAEQLVRSEAARQGRVALPRYCPGYPGWELADQAALFTAMCDGDARDHHVPIEVLPSGGLTPAKSTLAAFGVAPATATGQTLDCVRDFAIQVDRPTAAMQPPPAYAFPLKTLSLWRTKRLTITGGGSAGDSGRSVAAVFRFDGSTCTNMGVPLAFEYRVELQRELGGAYRIVGCDCAPAADRPGYQSMCRYLDAPRQYMDELAAYRPLVGSLLDEALAWNPPTSPAGCLCSQASQDHKWRAVFHTIHFALNGHEQPIA